MSNGDGSARIIKTRVPLSLSDLTLVVDDSRGDHEYLQSLSDAVDYFPIAITYASGQVWQARAIITGEMQVSSQSATASVSLMGPGNLTRQ
jgi:hypothetical protein